MIFGLRRYDWRQIRRAIDNFERKQEIKVSRAQRRKFFDAVREYHNRWYTGVRT